MPRSPIHTDNAPQAIGTYSQALRVGDTVYLSGQIGLDPKTMRLVDGIAAQIEQVLMNLKSVSQAAGGSLQSVVKLTVYLTDLEHFPIVNELMAQYLQVPYPARAVVQVSRLPREALVEIDAIMSLA